MSSGPLDIRWFSNFFASLWVGRFGDMIVLKDLYFSFTPSSPLFTALNLIIPERSAVCLVGREGAGKSTLLKIIKGLITPCSGSVSFHFSDPVTFENVGYLGGDPRESFVGSTVEEEIVFGPENLGLEVLEIQKRLDEALLLSGLSGYQKRLTHTLSGGEQQKLAVASVLVMNLKVLLMDDALCMMDPSARALHWSWINRTRRDLGLSLIFTTSSLEELRSADRVVFLDRLQHNFVFDGSPNDFIAGPLADEWVELENGVEKIRRELESANYLQGLTTQ